MYLYVFENYGPVLQVSVTARRFITLLLVRINYGTDIYIIKNEIELTLIYLAIRVYVETNTKTDHAQVIFGCLFAMFEFTTIILLRTVVVEKNNIINNTSKVGGSRATKPENTNERTDALNCESTSRWTTTRTAAAPKPHYNNNNNFLLKTIIIIIIKSYYVRHGWL